MYDGHHTSMTTPRAQLPSEARPGSVLAQRFRIERLLGAGGMGAVLEATRLETGQRVAVKLLLESGEVHPEARVRFEREAQLAARLESAHVVSILDFDRTATGLPFIVMERLEGRDLAEILHAEGALPIERAVDLIAEACLGVGAAHAAGLVHRDLKPSNLFLAELSDGAEIVKVLDFGLSKALDSVDPALTASAASFGTPQYMAPEQIQSTKHVDARCDQHALGMILYELVTGRPAYTAETAGAIYVAICTHPAPKASAARAEVPAELDAAIRRALAKAPGERFPDLAGFLEAIAPFGSATARRAAVELGRMLAASAPTLIDQDPQGLESTLLRTPTSARSVALEVSDVPTLFDPARTRARRLKGLALLALVGAAALSAALVHGQRSNGPVAAASARLAEPPPSTLAESLAPTSEAVAAAEPAPSTAVIAVTPEPQVLRAGARPSARPAHSVAKPAASGRTAPRAPTSDPVEVFGARR